MSEHTPVRLDCAPVGLFMCMGELCVKTEYREASGAVTAYIVSSGEFFWGPSPQSVATQNAADVTPVPDFDPAAVQGLIEAAKRVVRDTPGAPWTQDLSAALARMGVTGGV